MMANLLAHCDLFAGIAESGAHNRTLTPFGPKASGAPPGQAPDALKMSPFMYADKIKTPVRSWRSG